MAKEPRALVNETGVTPRLDDGRLATLVEAAEAGERQRAASRATLASLAEDRRIERGKANAPAQSMLELRSREYYAAEIEAIDARSRGIEKTQAEEGRLQRERAVDALAEEGMPLRVWVRSGDRGYKLNFTEDRNTLYHVPWDILCDVAGAANTDAGSLRQRIEDTASGVRRARKMFIPALCISLVLLLPVIIVALFTLAAVLPGIELPSLSVYRGVLSLQVMLLVLGAPIFMGVSLARPRGVQKKYLPKRRLSELESATSGLRYPLTGAEHPEQRESYSIAENPRYWRSYKEHVYWAKWKLQRIYWDKQDFIETKLAMRNARKRRW